MSINENQKNEAWFRGPSSQEAGIDGDTETIEGEKDLFAKIQVYPPSYHPTAICGECGKKLRSFSHFYTCKGPFLSAVKLYFTPKLRVFISKLTNLFYLLSAVLLLCAFYTYSITSKFMEMVLKGIKRSIPQLLIWIAIGILVIDMFFLLEIICKQACVYLMLHINKSVSDAWHKVLHLLNLYFGGIF
ncbi:MAG: hypothetical protein ACOC4M_15225 [Promethearchaeia archaeon]